MHLESEEVGTGGSSASHGGHVGSFRAVLVRGVLRESAQGELSLEDRRKVGLESGGEERLLRF